MIIRQTTTIVFEYPQDYLQEQEWCKTKEDRWIHKSTDTMCTVYENTISYSIGQPNSSEKPNNCEDEFFREPTAEERKAVADYIDSISVPTGVNIFDLMDEQTERSER